MITVEDPKDRNYITSYSLSVKGNNGAILSGNYFPVKHLSREYG